MPNDAQGSLDSDPSGATQQAEAPDVETSGTQSSAEETVQESSPKTELSTEPEAEDREATAILKGLDPDIPPVDRAQWKKLYHDVQSLAGRLRAQARRGAEVSEQTARRARMYQELAAIPGLTDFILGGHYGQSERMANGLSRLAAYFRVDPASLVGTGGTSAPQSVRAREHEDDPEAWTKIKDPKVLYQYWKDLAEKRARAIVEHMFEQNILPLYRNQEQIQRESEIARLTAKYPDLPKYRSQIDQLTERHPELPIEDAFLLAKARAGGFRTKSPNPALAVSEEPNARAEAGELDTEKELQKMVLGAAGRKALDF